jgi:dsDNA-specific endonuclease/ATPase MutS2
MRRRHHDKRLENSDADAESPFAEPVVLPLQDFIDLHPFAPKDIPSVVEEYLGQCALAKFREVRIIHGRGTGVQRNIVRSILQKHPLVLSFQDAPAEAGGWGATVAILKNESQFPAKGSSPLALIR